MPLLLFTYIARTYLIWLSFLFFSLLIVTFLFDFVELLRRAGTKDKATFDLVLQMAFYHLPALGLKLLPFAVLFSAMTAFWRLTRSQELIVARAAGFSIWQILFPVLISTSLISVIITTAINPLAANFLSRFEQLENLVLRGESSKIRIASDGIWLRQAENDGHSVIHARYLNVHDRIITDVIIFLFEKHAQQESRFKSRIDAARATLEPGEWRIEDGWITSPEKAAQKFTRLTLPTDLTLDRILDGFASPETMSFWALPGFIRAVQESGFSARRHRLQFNRLLADPFLLCALVLVAAPFSLRMTRRGGVMRLALLGLASGLLVYFLSDIIYALGLSGSLPISLAVWTPVIVSALFGITLLLHTEDG